ncbi:SPOR domain-containing protein [Aurantimonas sp. Leaf443]|uniref:SPOR domain-containing protein n=1 Tax=Aurantimonas sp. Leaf443 TaxID=1736378 RepID=UPI000700A670|nr:SPOR domain-containing protein [Aurantimonas sp. Leaf443]KQT82547.1 hypothetical protein ASG48_15900 [Aurantimonas sp. Leaf443]
MGEHTGPDRRNGHGGGHAAEPFVERARFGEEPWAPQGSPVSHRASARDDASLVDTLTAELEDEFHAAFEAEMAAPVRPAPAIPAPRRLSMGSAAPATLPEIEIGLQHDLEIALRGLSAPHRPRDQGFQHTEAFAPARDHADSLDHGLANPADDFDQLIASELAAMQQFAAAPVPAHGFVPAEAYDDEDDGYKTAAPVSRAAGGSAQARGFAHAHPQDEFEDDLDAQYRPSPAVAARLSPRRFGLGLGMMSLLLAGTAGAYMLYSNASSGLVAGGPILIKAETDPVKVLPKDPGGKAIPNQNKAVYERVQSAQSNVAPSQATLMTAVEEPVDLPREEEEAVSDDLPGVDIDPIDSQLTSVEAGSAEPVRVADASSNADDAAILRARKVRTMTVRPDGTLVESDAVPTADPALIAAAAGNQQISSLIADPATVEGIDSAATTPVPVALPRPADNPRKATVDPVRTAALQPAPATPAPAAAPEPVSAAPVAAAPPAVPSPSGYYVQISSQPSEAAAQESARSLGKRLAGALGGRPLSIQSADIPGKGTFYRVRAAAGSKEEASSLCEAVKSAGGSCFVAR